MKKKSEAQHHIFSQIRNPVSVKILIFVNQHVNLKDYTFLSSCSNLVRLDLSQNAISHLPKEFLLSRLQRLKVLMLHHNQLVRLGDVQAVFEVPQVANAVAQHRIPHSLWEPANAGAGSHPPLLHQPDATVATV